MSRHFRIGLCCTVALVALSAALPRPSLAALEDSQSYITDAKARIAKGDLRGAEIQLRNAVRANPSDPALHVELARLYLEMANLPAAEAEARLARQYKGPIDAVDPLLAQALLQENKFTELFRDVQPGDRSAKAESQVRLALGTAHLVLQEMDQAEPLLREAERLDTAAAGPKAAMAQYLLATRDISGAQKEVDAGTAIAPDDPDVERMAALVLLAQGKSDEAIAKLDAILSKDPNNVRGLATRGDVLMGQNKLKEAEADIDRAMKLMPNNAGLVFLDGVLLAREGKLAAAEAQLSKASMAFNNIPYGYFLEGIVQYRLGQYEQAASSLSKYIARFPKAAAPRRLVAQIDILNHNYSDAIDVLKPATDADPNDVTSELILAQAYIATGRRNDALALYQRAADANPNSVEAQSNLAAIEQGLGQVQRGLGELDKLAQTAEGATVAGPALVIGDLRAGRISDADKEAEALVKRNEKDMVAQSLLASVRMVQGNYSDAAKIFKGIVDKDPTLPGAQRGLAGAYMALGRPDDAKSVLQGLVKQYPNSLPDVILLAQLDAHQKNDAAAAELLKVAQQNAPKNPAPGLALLQIYGAAKAWDKAQTYGRDLEGEFPANPEVINTIAMIRAAAGDAKGAAAEFSKLVQAMPNSPTVLVRDAQFQNAAGDKTGARASLREAVSLAPSDAGPMQALVAFEMTADGPDSALEAARSFAQQEPEASAFLEADVLEKTGRATEAVSLLTKAQQDQPSSMIAAKLGEVLYAAGKREEAKQMLQSWLKSHDDNGPQLELANIYMSEHDNDAALALYEQVHDKAPNDVLALNSLATLYAEKHDPRAMDFAAQAYRLSPQPAIADTLGWALVQNDHAGEALPLLRGASVALPQNATIKYHLAVALGATGDDGASRALLQSLVQSGVAFDEKGAAEHLLAQLQHD
jgi:putative PEP-CTERM system TPR-repeat lipoprotein